MREKFSTWFSVGVFCLSFYLGFPFAGLFSFVLPGFPVGRTVDDEVSPLVEQIAHPALNQVSLLRILKIYRPPSIDFVEYRE